MPPWPPAAGCGDFADARTLSAAEIAVFAAWDQGGAPAAIRARPRGADGRRRSRPPSVTLDPGDSYRPNAATSDDYHCFLVDPGLASAQDSSASTCTREPRPACTTFWCSLSRRRRSPGAEQGRGRAGARLDCFAGSGLGTARRCAADDRRLGPGAGASASRRVRDPPGRRDVDRGPGALQPARRRGLRRPHDGRPALRRDARSRSARSSCRSRTPPSSFRRARPTRSPPSCRCRSDRGRCGGSCRTCTCRAPRSDCRCSTPRGDATCAIDIPHWNFHWQGFYYYKQPLPVGGGDVVHHPAATATPPGAAPLTWGEKTTDEMCLAFAYVAPMD